MRPSADDTLKMPIAQSKLKNPYNNSALSFSDKEIVFNEVYFSLTCGHRVLNSRFLRGAMQWAAPSNFETFLGKLAFFSPLNVSWLLTTWRVCVSQTSRGRTCHRVATRHSSTSLPRWCRWKLPWQVQCVSVYTVRLNVVKQTAHSWGQLAGV